MIVELSKVKPNPFRDFKIDPIYPERVEMLVKSIKQNDFWNGPTGRPIGDGYIELAAGHHRIDAAKLAGVTHADLVVKDYDDEAMVRIYSEENASHRGHSASAQAGSVASAIRIALWQDFWLDKLSSQNRTDQGIGVPRICKILGGSLGERAIKDQLAILKASGDYDRTVDEVITEVEAVRLAELEAAEQARIAAEEAARRAEERRQAAATEAERKRAEREARRATEASARATAEAERQRKEAEEAERRRERAEKGKRNEAVFDLGAARKYFGDVKSHIKIFYDLATQKGIEKYLQYEGQAGVAEQIVTRISEMRDAKGNPVRRTSALIEQVFLDLIHPARVAQRREEERHRAERASRSWRTMTEDMMAEFSRHARGLLSIGHDLSDHLKKRPKDEEFYTTTEFRQALDDLVKVANLLKPEKESYDAERQIENNRSTRPK